MQTWALYAIKRKRNKQELNLNDPKNEKHTHTGKRLVNVSITLSYGLIPAGVVLGASPDTFAAALHKIWEGLKVAVNQIIRYTGSQEHQKQIKLFRIHMKNRTK